MQSHLEDAAAVEQQRQRAQDLFEVEAIADLDSREVTLSKLAGAMKAKAEWSAITECGLVIADVNACVLGYTRQQVARKLLIAAART